MNVSSLPGGVYSEQLQNQSDKAQNLQKTIDSQLNAKDDQKLKDSCHELESVFISQLIKCMRDTVPKDSLLGDDFGQGVFQSMLDDEYAKSISQTDTIGLSKMLYDQLKFNMALASQQQQPVNK
jgi:flagellar protein FlgJ